MTQGCFRNNLSTGLPEPNGHRNRTQRVQKPPKTPSPTPDPRLTPFTQWSVTWSVTHRYGRSVGRSVGHFYLSSYIRAPCGRNKPRKAPHLRGSDPSAESSKCTSHNETHIIQQKKMGTAPKTPGLRVSRSKLLPKYYQIVLTPLTYINTHRICIIGNALKRPFYITKI